MRVAHRAAIAAAALGVGLFPLATPAHATEAAAADVAVQQISARTAVVPQAASLASRTWRLAFASPQTLDTVGVQPSLYRGRFYRATVERERRCIVRRESSGHYTSVSHSGYRGAYQMSTALARGATWMMLPEFTRIMGATAADRAMERLRATPTHRWTRYWQDAAFSTVYNWKHAKSGAKHWNATRHHC
jgi:hypothetical protein